MRLLILGLVIVSLFSCKGKRPDSLGVNEQGVLANCPDKPNCVSTYATDDHKIAPIKFESAEKAKALLKKAIEQVGGAKIVHEAGNYWHVEFTTPILGFVDDVEFVFDDVQKLIQFRSASRLGYSDMGANRKRMEAIRFHFHQVTL